MTERQQLDAELTAILPYLPGWKLDPTYANHTWCAVLIDGTGRGIHVSITQAKGRFYISGMWPSDSDHQQCRPDKCQHITIARNRQPEKAAAEITRRFLPWYTAAYAEQNERTTWHNAARNRQQEVTAELAALLGQKAAQGRKAIRTGFTCRDWPWKYTGAEPLSASKCDSRASRSPRPCCGPW